MMTSRFAAYSEFVAITNKSRRPLSATSRRNLRSGSLGTELPVHRLTGSRMVPGGSFLGKGGGTVIHDVHTEDRRAGAFVASSVYLPTYIGGFLPAGLPPVRYPAGNTHQLGDSQGVWLGESQEACALLTMTNCPALRRHIYANLGARVEKRARRLEPTNLLAPFSFVLPFPHSLFSSVECRNDSPRRRRKFSELRISRVNSLPVFASSFAKWSLLLLHVIKIN